MTRSNVSVLVGDLLADGKDVVRGGGRRRRGFTLLEVMISSMISMTLALGFTPGMVSSIKTQIMSATSYRANSIASNRLQHLKCISYDMIPLMAETDTPVDQYGQELVDRYGNKRNNGRALGRDKRDGDTYRRSTTVTTPAGMTDTLDVTVDVIMPTPSGKANHRPVTVRTRIVDMD